MLISKMETKADKHAELVIRSGSGTVLAETVARMGKGDEKIDT